MSAHILFAVDGAIATITINRPQARNAFTLDMYRGLKARCEEAAANPAIRALIITGAGEEAFAAGTDIAEFRAFKTAEDALAYEGFIDEVLAAIEACRFPTIAAMAGACTGGGAAIAVRCDLRIAADNLRFGFPIARTLGNCLSQVNLAHLAGLIGPQRVIDIIFTARLMEATESLAIGLVNEVVKPADLAGRARNLAERVAGHAPLTLYATKEALRRQQRGLDQESRDLIALCYGSDDFREGMEAFLAKRRAQWKGR